LIADLAEMVLAGVHREYPNQIPLLFRSAADLATPRALFPAFYGSFDWHSAVHSHWALARASRVLPVGDLRDRCLGALAESLTPEKIAVEAAFRERRPGFEVPYGVAWLLLLTAELEEIGAAREAAVIAPLAELGDEHLARWLGRLVQPVRSGQHDQSAFALGLFLDASRLRGRPERAAQLAAAARRLHGDDIDAPLRFEPSNHDFLSPALAEADLMRRVLAPGDFSTWLAAFLPGIPTDGSSAWLVPVECPDASDGRLSHRIGLNLSRSWMLEAIAVALGGDDPRAASLRAVAARHGERGRAEIDPAEYAGSHWLGTFAIYGLTGGSEPGLLSG
jgi:hypothetical protein